MNLSLGIDFGTSGARFAAVDGEGRVVARGTRQFDRSLPPGKWPSMWRKALFELLAEIPVTLRSPLHSIALNGTSGTVLLCDRTGTPITPPLAYNHSCDVRILDQLKAIAPPRHPVLSTTSSLAKLLWWQQTITPPHSSPIYFLHQADWLGYLLHKKLGMSDYHNSLKLGYDVVNLHYPKWLLEGIRRPSKFVPQLPEVVAPGTPVGTVCPSLREQFGFSPNCTVKAGTTDSIAAFLASGAVSVGEAVTSLGSTLVLKLLSQTRVDDARYGIYSHRLGDLWLTGGASNTGGAVLRHFFGDRNLETLSHQIDPDTESPLDYYPLLEPGDRFPVNDPNLPPKLDPRPESDVEFLHGLLSGIARIEARGYQLLQELGATPPQRVYTAGGGAKNPVWTTIRARHLGVPVILSPHTEAAYGTARLAMGELGNFKL
ncbi:FGGY-family carbohydrate kinase [Lyngbya sp. CCY1209]|uniref:FGGY-family carbohydrate kinase n=1 Tax=Lyngbya sp. CCY1209 TaxID=2886103 RepID=UPI002D208C84|nr:FGGY-family carbohydrate kinase [Lyngbya sp. CCY1209]MEB3885391.1 FGGY-family carbohydrate kinase [Lyngbya sp. CCY1209]